MCVRSAEQLGKSRAGVIQKSRWKQMSNLHTEKRKIKERKVNKDMQYKKRTREFYSNNYQI